MFAARKIFYISFFSGLLVLFFIFTSAPKNFPKGEVIKIEKGESLGKISRTLKEKSIIRSEAVFQTLTILFGGDRRLVAGHYAFERKASAVNVAWRISTGNFGIKLAKVTLPEGLTRKEMADVIAGKLESFDRQKFLEITKDDEGYLFPDTYYFFPAETAEEIAVDLGNNFKRKISSLEEEIKESKYSLPEIITMASLVEKESAGDEERPIIAGILWKRLENGQRLQVDASLWYVTGRFSAELTISDLNLDSPYNTYKYGGLPPGPIGNPGLASIKAALDPEDSPYLFYLHDKDGGIHYARNFEEHKLNKQKYLK
jgi:UPF0755 protein